MLFNVDSLDTRNISGGNDRVFVKYLYLLEMFIFTVFTRKVMHYLIWSCLSYSDRCSICFDPAVTGRVTAIIVVYFREKEEISWYFLMGHYGSISPFDSHPFAFLHKIPYSVLLFDALERTRNNWWLCARSLILLSRYSTEMH